jgi:hypothetical protein
MMAMPDVQPVNTTAIEPKVKWGAIGAYVVGVLALSGVKLLSNNDLLAAALPDALEIFVFPLVPTVASLLSGYAARHQWRAGEGDTAGTARSYPPA